MKYKFGGLVMRPRPVQITRKERKELEDLYLSKKRKEDAARNRALTRLIVNHEEEFKTLLEDERNKE